MQRSHHCWGNTYKLIERLFWCSTWLLFVKLLYSNTHLKEMITVMQAGRRNLYWKTDEMLMFVWITLFFRRIVTSVCQLCLVLKCHSCRSSVFWVTGIYNKGSCTAFVGLYFFAACETLRAKYKTLVLWLHNNDRSQIFKTSFIAAI